jgi:hypothetical protein
MLIETAFSDTVATRSFAAEDRRALNVVKSSVLVRAADDTVDAITMAWRHSRLCARYVRIADRWTAMTARSRVRLGGVLTASASATALVGQQLSPRPEPMTWIVPALGLCIGICLALGSSERSRR